MPKTVISPSILQENETFTDLMRKVFKGIIDPVAAFLNRLGLTPNTVTLAGLAGHFLAGCLVFKGWTSWAGIVLLILAPLDALDGAMARQRGESNKFGAFTDSVTDRYSEFVIFGSLLFYFALRQDWITCAGVYLAVSGSIMVSYIRSRAESLGFNAKNGLLSRLERYIILIACLIFNIPIIAIWLIAVFSHFTALQRIFYIRKQAFSTQAESAPLIIERK